MPRQFVSEVESNENAIGKGQRAAGVLRSLDPFINEYIDSLLNSLVITGSGMTDQEMRLVVGKILGMRELKSRLDSLVTKGHIASERRDGC